jgi:hypothetical protein
VLRETAWLRAVVFNAGAVLVVTGARCFRVHRLEIVDVARELVEHVYDDAATIDDGPLTFAGPFSPDDWRALFLERDLAGVSDGLYVTVTRTRGDHQELGIGLTGAQVDDNYIESFRIENDLSRAPSQGFSIQAKSP